MGRVRSLATHKRALPRATSLAVPLHDGLGCHAPRRQRRQEPPPMYGRVRERRILLCAGVHGVDVGTIERLRGQVCRHCMEISVDSPAAAMDDDDGASPASAKLLAKVLREIDRPQPGRRRRVRWLPRHVRVHLLASCRARLDVDALPAARRFSVIGFWNQHLQVMSCRPLVWMPCHEVVAPAAHLRTGELWSVDG
ncbi:hypothetical protein SEVIR_6G232450v4 [Setaria viridis]